MNDEQKADIVVNLFALCKELSPMEQAVLFLEIAVCGVYRITDISGADTKDHFRALDAIEKAVRNLYVSLMNNVEAKK